MAPEDALSKIPGTAESFPLAAAALSGPAAAIRLLDGFVNLKKGDVIVQNNAGSTVAQVRGGAHHTLLRGTVCVWGVAGAGSGVG